MHSISINRANIYIQNSNLEEVNYVQKNNSVFKRVNNQWTGF